MWDASMVFAKFLEKNCKRGKFSHSKLLGKRVIELGAGCGVAGFDSFGSIKLAELDWGNEDHIQAVGPPYDFIIGTNVMLEKLKRKFDFKVVPKSKMDFRYQHPSIQLFIMGLKPLSEGKAVERIEGSLEFDELKETESTSEGENNGSMNKLDDSGSCSREADCSVLGGVPSSELSHWEVRRYGAMAAWLLLDVKIA
ncbi:hypothetical protein AKJ16_DCAP07944 [Drosera capensis]